MATLSQTVVWMNNHPVLVGWVQAVGALVALFIVIGFPLWQRGKRVRQARIAKLSQDVTLAQSVLLILTDAKSWIDYVLWTRGHKTDDVTEVIDSAELISRLLVCEKSEWNRERLNALYLAHDAISRAQRTLVLPSPADNSSADCYGSLLRDDQAVLERQWSIVDAQLRQALYRLQFAKCPFYMRPLSLVDQQSEYRDLEGPWAAGRPGRVVMLPPKNLLSAKPTRAEQHRLLRPRSR